MEYVFSLTCSRSGVNHQAVKLPPQTLTRGHPALVRAPRALDCIIPIQVDKEEQH